MFLQKSIKSDVSSCRDEAGTGAHRPSKWEKGIARSILFGVLAGLCGVSSPVRALQISPLSPSLTALLFNLYPVDVNDIGGEDPVVKTDPEVQMSVKIWATHPSNGECNMENFYSGCRDHTLYFVIAESDAATTGFGFRVGPAFHIGIKSMRQISAGQNGGKACVLFTLEERARAKPQKSRNNHWLYKTSQICASPKGFVQYQPSARP